VRFLVRLIGYLFVAGGFIAAVLDGARSIANSAPRFTALGDTVAAVLHERYALIQPAIERNIHPLLWDPVLLTLLRMPVALVALFLGFCLLWLGQKPQPRIGFVTRR